MGGLNYTSLIRGALGFIVTRCLVFWRRRPRQSLIDWSSAAATNRPTCAKMDSLDIKQTIPTYSQFYDDTINIYLIPLREEGTRTISVTVN